MTLAEAAKWYAIAADKGDTEAQLNLGIFYSQGQGSLPKDDTLAVKWFTKAADAQSEAKYMLGVMSKEGRGGLQKSDADAVRWFTKAANEGDGNAQYAVALMYSDGRGGLPKDEAAAVKWLRESAYQGNTAAGGPLQKLAIQGNPEAQYVLGELYSLGKGGLTEDEDEALRWWIESAWHGNKDALNRIRAHANSGNREAQSILGSMYLKGVGADIPVDRTEAIKWFTKSARGGNVSAQRALRALNLDW